MAKRFATSCFIVLGVCIFLISCLSLVMFLAPGFSVFGIKYIAKNTHVINKKYKIVEELGDFSGSIIVDCHELPVYVYFTEEWDYRIEYYDNYNGLTTSKFDDPKVTLKRTADGSAMVSISEYRRFLYESSSSERYLKIFIPLTSVYGEIVGGVPQQGGSAYKTNLNIYSETSQINFSKIVEADPRTPRFNLVTLETNGSVSYSTHVQAKTFKYSTDSSIVITKSNKSSVDAENYVLNSRKGKIQITRPVAGDINATTDLGDITLVSCKNLVAKANYGSVHSSGNSRVDIAGIVNITTKAGNVYLGEVSGNGENKIKTGSGEVGINKILNGSIVTTRGPIEIKSVNNMKIETNVGRVEIEEVLTAVDISSTRGNVYLGGEDMLINNPTVFAKLGRVFVKAASGTVDIRTMEGNVEFKNTNSENITIYSGGKLKATNLKGLVNIDSAKDVNLQFESINNNVTIVLRKTCKKAKIEALNNAYDEIRYLLLGKWVTRYGDNGAGSFTIREASDTLNTSTMGSGPLLKITGKSANISLYMQNETI